MCLPTTKIEDRFGRHQENPQQQQNPQRVFEYSQPLNLEKRELYPPPIRGNKLFCPQVNTGTRSHLYKVKNGKMTWISLVFWATELDTSLSSSICQPASVYRYRARVLALFRGGQSKNGYRAR